MPGDVRLIRSPISVGGMVLTTISAVLFLVVFLADVLGLHTNPYIGIVFFLVLPGVFVIGLLMIPLGASVERWRRAAGRPPTEVRWPQIDLNDSAQRTTAIIVFSLTMANIVIVSLGAYRGIGEASRHVSNTVRFGCARSIVVDVRQCSLGRG